MIKTLNERITSVHMVIENELLTEEGCFNGSSKRSIFRRLVISVKNIVNAAKNNPIVSFVVFIMRTILSIFKEELFQFAKVSPVI